MKPALLTVGAAVVLVSVLWVFVGIERIVGDHEVGVSWEPFVKHYPSLQVLFANPAQQDLEIISIDAMSPAERAAFMDFCRIRFGVTDAEHCHALLLDRRV